MNKSIIWRVVLVVLILVGWGISIFPYKDRDFVTVFNEQVEKYKTEDADPAVLADLLDEAQKRVEATEAARAEDPDSDAAQGPRSVADALYQVADQRRVQLKDYMQVRRGEKATNKDVVNYVRRQAMGRIRLGTDLRGGSEIVVAFDPDEAKAKDRGVVETRDDIVELLRNRIDSTGTLGAELRPSGDNKISIRVPATDPADVDRIISILQQPAELRFREVHTDQEGQLQKYASGEGVDVGWRVMPMIESHDGIETETLIVVKQAEEQLTGERVSNAYVSMGELGQNMVILQFDAEGAASFGQITSQMVGKRLAVELDGTVRSAPVINEAIFGNAQISGSFSQQEAQDLATVLKAGNLPVKISVEGVNTTQPTLGLETIKAGIYAGAGGMLVVILFMVAYYRGSGLIAVFALAANAVLVLGFMPILDATLTLPGIAGMVLTIGMAVDANVLIFERIREEQEAGKNIMTAVKNGYDKVFSTILDANLTTLFTAFFLYKFGSGPIKGFAVTLSVGIVASMFTALFVTRLIYDMLLEGNVMKRAGMMQFFKAPNFQFMSKARMTIIGSAVVIVAALAIMGIRGKNAYAIDFTGGLQLQYTYEQQVPTGEVEQVLADLDHPAAVATYKFSALQGSRTLEILVRDIANADGETKAEDTGALIEKVQSRLNEAHPEAKISAGSATVIGALVGQAFQEQALIAIGLSLLAMIVYISFRFEFAYAIGAVACLMHDVIITTGIFLIWGHREISLNVIAALLTIIGYSLNDTIVVYDRIRENVGLNERAKFEDIVNTSINQTLSRTTLTSLTTLFTVVTLYVFGGGAINDFALIMMIGVIAGTYSTIFIATPIMMWWHNYRATAKAAAKAEAEALEKAEKTGNATA